MNSTPCNFKYHWPYKEYKEIYDTQNWFINFEDMKIFIDSCNEVHTFTIIDNRILFDGMYNNAGQDVIDAFLNYTIQKEMLE